MPLIPGDIHHGDTLRYNSRLILSRPAIRTGLMQR
jgi:hypothetical protein